MSGDFLPDGWRSTTLGELGTLRRGRGGTKKDERPTGVPCVRYGDLYTVHGSIIERVASFIAPSRAHRYTPLRYGDVVFAASGETHEEIGTAAAYCGSDTIVAGADTIIFRPNGSVVPRFIGYAVNAEAVATQKARFGQGSSVIHISAKHLPHLMLPLPTIREQRRIAEILDTVDEAVRKTEDVIEKLKAMSRGLLHDLLTRGIDENGELRDPERRPREFKDSPLGRIPREWKLKNLGTLSGVSVSNVNKKSIPGEAEVDLCNYMDVYGHETIGAELDFMRATASLAQIERFQLRPGDVLITKDSETPYDIAVPAVVGPHIQGRSVPLVCGYHLALLRPDSSVCEGEFLARVLSLPSLGAYFARQAHGSTRYGLRIQSIESAPIPVAGLAEQREVIRRMGAVRERLNREHDVVSKLRLLKQGLMDDLLTGRVRVKIADEAA